MPQPHAHPEIKNTTAHFDFNLNQNVTTSKMVLIVLIAGLSDLLACLLADCISILWRKPFP